MAQPTIQTQSDRLIDLTALFTIIRQRLWPIVIVILVVLALTAVAYMLATRRFMATASVAVDRQTPELVTVDNSSHSSVPVTDSGTVDTQVQILESPTILAAVVDRLHLDRRSGFGITAGAPPVPPALARARATNAVGKILLVARQGTSYAIDITATTADPQLSADLVNAAADAYVNGTVAQRSDQRRRDIDLLANRLGQLRGAATQADQAVADYRASTNLADLNSNTPAAQELLSSLTTQLAQARADLAAASARSSASLQGATDTSATSSVVRDLRVQQAQLSAQRDQLASRYGPRHPTLQALEQQLREISDQLARETRNVRVSTTSDATIARQRVASIEASLADARSAQFAGNASTVRLNELQRNAESTRTLYQAFLDRYRQSVASQGAEPPDAHIIALATVPDAPTSPKLPVYLIGGIVAALLGAIIAVLLLELMERGYRSRAEAEAGLGTPVIAMIPDLASVKGAHFKRGTPLQVSQNVLDQETSIYSESIRSLRTALRLGQGGQTARTVAIASALPGEGKTSVAISLARSAARAGMKVILVDCDLRQRASSRNLADKLGVSLTDVLRGTQPLERAIFQDSASGASLLAQQPDSPADFDAITSKAMEDLLDRLAARFDLVVLDTAPVVPLAEARALAAMADATVLVVRWRKTPAQIAETAVRELQRSGANVVGVALCQVDARAALSASDMAQYRAYQPAFT